MVRRQYTAITTRPVLIALGALFSALALLGYAPAQDTAVDPDGELSVALTGKYPPFSFPGNDGELTGFDVEVSREVADRLGLGTRIIQTEWDGILAGLLGERYDAIIGSMAITPQRAERVLFSDPYYISGAQLFARPGGDPLDISADEARIGVVLGTTYEQFLRQEHPQLDIRTYKGDVDIFQDMANGRLDGFVTDRLVGLYQISEAGLEFEPVGGLLYEEQIAIPVLPSRPELAEAINGALADMRADGTMATLHRRWFGRSMIDSNAGVDPDGVLSVALTGKYPPFSFPSNDGEITGFDVDVSKAVAERLGLGVQVIQTEWDGILAGLLGERYDAIIGSMAITPEREERVLFTDPYYVSGAQLFATAGVQPPNLERDPATIGVVLGTTYEQYLRQAFPQLEIRTYKGDVDIFQDMANTRLDGFVTDRLVGLYQISQAGLNFEPVGDLLYEERIAIPIIKSRPDLRDAVNEALASMRADGSMENLHVRWFGRSMMAEGDSGSITAADLAAASTAGGGLDRISTGRIVSMLGRGFLVTLFVAFLSLGLGFLLSIPAGVVLHYSSGLPKFALRLVVDFLRGTPVLIQLFFVYFGSPQIFRMVGLEWSLSPVASAVFTLSINAAAYMAEVIRSGLMAVDPGQVTAGKSLGLTKLQTFRFIVWPQAFRVAIPPLMNSTVALIKDTALVSVISVAEVVREAQSIISITFNPMLFYFVVGVLFFVVTFPLMKWASRLETKIEEKGFSRA